MEILEHIPVGLEPEEIRRSLYMEGLEHDNMAQALMEAARPLIRARALYRVCYIDVKSENGVSTEGTSFKSRVLRRNLDEVERIFPYVVTIGDRLERKADACEDLLEQYCLDAIGNIALSKAREGLEERLRSRFCLDGLSMMSPGSLEDWALEEQRPLFSLLGDVTSAIGVKLNQHLFMIPRKSVSGIYFPTDVPFFSCQLCARKKCPERKARYDVKLAREYGSKH